MIFKKNYQVDLFIGETRQRWQFVRLSAAINKFLDLHKALKIESGYILRLCDTVKYKNLLYCIDAE